MRPFFKVPIVALAIAGSFFFAEATFAQLDPNFVGPPAPTTSASTGSCEPNDFLVSVGIPEGRLIPCVCTEGDQLTEDGKNACGITEMLITIVNFTKIILGLAGSAALLIFTIGGIYFIISMGNAEQVNKAKAMLKAAAIGIAIILLSWIIVNFVISGLTEGKKGVTSLPPSAASQN